MARVRPVPLVNAGMDVHQDCKVGGLHGIDELLIALREEMVPSAWPSIRETICCSSWAEPAPETSIT